MEIKICGLTNLQDAQTALQAGADYLGFVLYSKSPRGITPETLASIVTRIPKETRVVAVFVNTPPNDILTIARDCRLFAVQLHGNEAAKEFENFPIPVWRAIREVNNSWMPSFSSWSFERLVVDSSVPGQYGGTGIAADWKAAQHIASSQKIMLAGGLTPDNVATAIQTVRPFGIDVSSGVEKSPGIKDPAKIRAFITSARGAPM